MHEVLVNGLGGLSLPRKSVVRFTDRPGMTLDVYHGRKTTIQQQQQLSEARNRYVSDVGGSINFVFYWYNLENECWGYPPHQEWVLNIEKT